MYLMGSFWRTLECEAMGMDSIHKDNDTISDKISDKISNKISNKISDKVKAS